MATCFPTDQINVCGTEDKEWLSLREAPVCGSPALNQRPQGFPNQSQELGRSLWKQNPFPHQVMNTCVDTKSSGFFIP